MYLFIFIYLYIYLFWGEGSGSSPIFIIGLKSILNLLNIININIKLIGFGPNEMFV